MTRKQTGQTFSFFVPCSVRRALDAVRHRRRRGVPPTLTHENASDESSSCAAFLRNKVSASTAAWTQTWQLNWPTYLHYRTRKSLSLTAFVYCGNPWRLFSSRQKSSVAGCFLYANLACGGCRNMRLKGRGDNCPFLVSFAVWWGSLRRALLPACFSGRHRPRLT